MPKRIPYSSLKPDRWPPQIRTLVDLRQAPRTPLGKVNVAVQWRESTYRSHLWNLGYFLGWLEWSGRLDGTASLQTLVTLETLTDYVDAMRGAGLSPRTIAARLTAIRAAMAALCPNADVRWLIQGIKRLAEEPSDRRQTLQRSQHTERLVELGMSLIRSAMLFPLSGPEHAHAVDYRDGLLIVFTALVVPRLGTLPVMMVDEHLVRHGSTYKVKWQGTQMKGGRRAYEAVLPDELGSLIERYLEIYRPVLAARSRKAANTTKRQPVWLNRRGAAMGARSIYDMIIARTKAAFRVAVYPHAFRHSAATSLILERPDLIKLITPLLQHHTTSMRNTYILAERVEAGLRYGEMLAARRRGRRRSSRPADRDAQSNVL